MSAILTAVLAALISSGIGALVGAAVSGIKNISRKEKRQEKAERLGVQCLLRTQLLDFHDKYTERGYCPTYAKEAIMNEYQAYHELGGNGLITRFYDEILALPDKPPGENEKDGK